MNGNRTLELDHLVSPIGSERAEQLCGAHCCELLATQLLADE